MASDSVKDDTTSLEAEQPPLDLTRARRPPYCEIQLDTTQPRQKLFGLYVTKISFRGGPKPYLHFSLRYNYHFPSLFLVLLPCKTGSIKFDFCSITYYQVLSWPRQYGHGLPRCRRTLGVESLWILEYGRFCLAGTAPQSPAVGKQVSSRCK